MPVLLPPAAFSNLTDGVLTGVAQGDVLYRGPTAWNNLPHGTAGQLLTTQGAGANPTWANVAGGMGAVVTAPSSSAQNTIQPTGASVVPLTVQGAAGQTAALFAVNDGGGQGALSLSAGRVLSVGSTYPSGLGALVINSYYAGGPTAPFLLLNDVGSGDSVGLSPLPGGACYISSGPTFSGGAATLACGGLSNPADGSTIMMAYHLWTYDGAVNYYTGRLGVGINVATLPGAATVLKAEADSLAALAVQGLDSAQTAPLIELQQISSTSTARDVALLDGVFANATDATRQGRLVLSAVDYNATREGLRIEGNGSAAAIGFYGHTAVAQPTGYAVSGSSATKSMVGDGTDTLAVVGEVLGNLVKELLNNGLIHS